MLISATTRGAGAPPSLRQSLSRLVDLTLRRNEGRRRPSLIAAEFRIRRTFALWNNEGRRRPSLIAAFDAPRGLARGRGNEGRRRPSLIAAGRPARLLRWRGGQRGAPAPLPHCGGDSGAAAAYRAPTTRGAGAPPSLRLSNHFAFSFVVGFNEGRRRPSLIAATSQCLSIGTTSCNEGRRRPSLIAA